MYELVRRLSAEGIQVNATAVLALDQVGLIWRERCKAVRLRTYLFSPDEWPTPGAIPFLS